MSAQPEFILHREVCGFLRTEYPDVIFRTDFAAGQKMTQGQAMKQKQLQQSRAYPDLFIAQPCAGYAGLYLELKPEGTKLFKADGKTYKTDHLARQAKILAALLSKGYRAEFAIGYETAVGIIKDYLKPLGKYVPTEVYKNDSVF